MNKYKLYMIISLIILFMSITRSKAWYTWASIDNTSVSLGTWSPEISFVGGTTLNGEGTNAIYKNNVISNPSTPSNSSSKFLNTDIVRKNIQTITTAEYNSVSEGITGTDISSKGDVSVILWYEDYNCDRLLDIYMGSENGVIETNTNGQGMFAHLENVESLDLTNFDTSNVTTMYRMFERCKKLNKIDFRNADFSNVTDYNNMFYSAPSTVTIYVKDDAQKSWLNSKFTNLTNVKVAV